MKTTLSQTSFGYISINSFMIIMVSMAPKSPWKDLSIDTSHITKQSIMAEILGRSTGNHHGVRIANSWAEIKPTTSLSVLDKENSMEFSCIFCILLIQLLHGLCTTFPWLSCDFILCDVTLWHCHVTLSCTPSLCSKSKRKRKEKKRNINSDLAVLPSHDIWYCLLNHQYLGNRHDLSFAFRYQRSPLYTSQNECKMMPRWLILVEIWRPQCLHIDFINYP